MSVKKSSLLNPFFTKLFAAVVLFVGLAAGLSLPAMAQTYTGVPTNLASNNELMVSYRHQERMWQTPDGALHVITNGGKLQPNPGLVLYRSTDGGTTWLPSYAFVDSNKNSTVDGMIQNGVLTVVYSDANEYIQFKQLSYNAASGAWTLTRAETAYASQQFNGINPTVSIDDAGSIWCGFATQDRNTADIGLSVVARAAGASGWASTGLGFGPIDNVSQERSARMVRLPGAMGMIYRVKQGTFWTFRPNTAAITAPWSAAVRISEGVPQKKISDPYASHYSVIADSRSDLHLAVADDGDAMYLKYSLSSNTWTVPQKLNGKTKISYLQIGLWNGNVALAFSASRGAGAVLVSKDYGASFSNNIALDLPPAPEGVSYKTGRVETPGIVNGTLPVLQQYEDNKQQRILVFKVAAPTAP